MVSNSRILMCFVLRYSSHWAPMGAVKQACPPSPHITISWGLWGWKGAPSIKWRSFSHHGSECQTSSGKYSLYFGDCWYGLNTHVNHNCSQCMWSWVKMMTVIVAAMSPSILWRAGTTCCVLGAIASSDSFWVLSLVRETLQIVESVSAPMNCTHWDGIKWDLERLMQNPTFSSRPRITEMLWSRNGATRANLRCRGRWQFPKTTERPQQRFHKCVGEPKLKGFVLKMLPSYGKPQILPVHQEDGDMERGIL